MTRPAQEPGKELTLSPMRVGAWSGLVGSFLFVAVFTAEGFFRPGYSAMTTYISALSLGPRGGVQISNFMVWGICLAGFAGSFRMAMGPSNLTRWATGVTLGMAVLFYLSGPFVMDPMGTPRNRMSVHGLVHGLCGGLVFIAMPVVMLLSAIGFRRGGVFRSLSLPTMALAILILCSVATLTVATKIPRFGEPTAPYLGIIQRSIVVPFCLWVSLVSLAILGRSKFSSAVTGHLGRN